MTYKKMGPNSEIRLTAPWEQDSAQAKPVANPRISAELPNQVASVFGAQNIAVGPSDETALAFLQERSRVHETYIREQERTKRLGMTLAAALILGAAALVLFAPQGRETLSYWIGVALVIFAAGAMGYQRVWGQSKNLSFGADQDRSDVSPK